MDIKADFHDRTLKFRSVGEKSFQGEGLDKLLAKISKYGTMIKRVEINGESHSFTFTRQIYLFANLLSFISDYEVIICGEPIKGKALFPKYNNKI